MSQTRYLTSMMPLQNIQNINASYSTFNDVSGNQYNEYKFDTREDILKKLGPANMNFESSSSRRTECLKGTRADVLNFIIDWVSDPTSTQNVLWLYGLAGSGKSTILTTIANFYWDSTHLGAFIFFNRDVAERSDPAIVIRTLAYQLGSSYPSIRAAISAAIQSNPNINLAPLHFQFQKLIAEPIKVFHMPIIIILDGLDECGTANERDTLLTVLASGFPLSIRIIIASRAEVDILNAFKSKTNILAYEVDITSIANTYDILSYFRHHMNLLNIKNSHLPLGANWPPGDEVCLQLTKRASGLFVWASTAVEFINVYEPREPLNAILNGGIVSGAEAALDALYETALDSVGLWKDDNFVADFRAILGTVLVARQPLSCTAIDILLHLQYRPSIHTILCLGSILQRDPTVRILHPSFGDFLMNRDRCRRDAWFFDQTTCHQHLAFRCLDQMNITLKRNICGLTLSSRQYFHAELKEAVAYACTSWIDHTCMIRYKLAEIAKRLHGFFRFHLLHWFEAMSILKRSRETIAALGRLLNWIMINLPHKKLLVKFVSDARRFAQAHANIIEDHPLLVYLTGLPLCPTTCSLYHTFHKGKGNLFPSVKGRFQFLALLTLSGHTDCVTSAAFSPDGTRIVSSSDDKTVRLWDATSGAQLKVLTGHESCVRTAAFSPEGTKIISASYDRTIRLWDVTSGAVARIIKGHDGWVRHATFSPDGKIIASASHDKTVRVWDATSSAEVQVCRGHEDSVRSVAFSPNGRRVVSGSDDGTIRVWDVAPGADVKVLRGHTGWVRSVVFSADGMRIASGSADMTARIWDTASGDEVLILTGHGGWVNSVALSANRIVTGSADHIVRVWDAKSGIQICLLTGHHDWIQSVAFSPDGMWIVSASRDQTIRVWDTISSDEVSIPGGHHSRIRSLTFSPNGMRIVSCSYDWAVRVWDVASGDEVHLSLRKPKHWFHSVVFSADGTRMAAGSYNVVQVWNAISGVEELTLQGTHGYRRILSVAFSPDGKRIVSASKTIRVWDAISGDEVVALKGHTSHVHSLVFFPNTESERMVSGSEDKSIRVWNTTSGAEVLVIRGHEGSVQSVAISPDEMWIVSGSEDMTVRVWDATSGAGVRVLQGHGESIRSVEFSADGSQIISKSRSRAINWDASSGLRLFPPRSTQLLSPSLDVTEDEGWIVELFTGGTIGKIPNCVNVTCSASYGATLAVGTLTGQPMIMSFPLAVLASPETWAFQV